MKPVGQSPRFYYWRTRDYVAFAEAEAWALHEQAAMWCGIADRDALNAVDSRHVLSLSAALSDERAAAAAEGTNPSRFIIVSNENGTVMVANTGGLMLEVLTLGQTVRLGSLVIENVRPGVVAISQLSAVEALAAIQGEPTKKV